MDRFSHQQPQFREVLGGYLEDDFLSSKMFKRRIEN